MSRSLDPRLLRAVPCLRRLVMTLAALQLVSAVALIAQVGLLSDVLSGVVLHGRSGSSLLWQLELLGAVAAARALLAAGQEWLVGRASVRVRSELRLGVLRAVDRLGPIWLARQPGGRVTAATGPGLEALDGYVTRAVPAMVCAGVVPCVAVAAIAWADWRSALTLVVVLPLVPLFMVLVGVTTRRRMEDRYAALGRLAGHFLDLLQGLTTLKVYGQARRQVATVRLATEAYRRQTMGTLRLAFLSGLVLDLIATLSVAVVAVTVGLRLDAGRIGLPLALTALLLTPEVFAPLRAVGAQHHAAEEGRVAAAAALDILAEVSDVQQAVNAEPVRSKGSLAVRDLTVVYPDRAEPALNGVTLVVEPGELVAIQGVSGGGKSSLLAVLLGFVGPGAGTVAVGTDRGTEELWGLDLPAWRCSVAWVPQRPRPTQADVGAEVALGDPSASRAAVLAAIADCHAPHPETPLGEDGRSISAGQRRRVALARALLRARSVRAAGGVPVVLLDEPSEDLDRATEQVVAAVIGGLAGWATVLMVTHSERLAACAGRRIEIEAGRVVSDVRATALPPPPVLPAVPAPTPPRAVPAGSARPSSWRPLLAGARTAWRRLASAALLSAGTGLAGLALTGTSVWLICRAAQHPNLQALAIAVVGVRTFALARALLRYAERMVSHDVALRLLSELRAAVFTALEPLAPAGLSEFRSGDLLRRFVSDVDGVQEGLVRAVVPFSGAVLTGVGAVGFAALLLPAAAWTLAAGLLAGLVVAPWLAWRIAGDATAVSAAAGTRDERTTAYLQGLAELTAYGQSGPAIAHIAEADALVSRGAARSALGAAAGVAATGVAAAASLAFVVFLGAGAASRGGLPAVAVGVLVATVLAGFDALAGLPVAFAAWSRFRTGLQRVAALLATPVPMAEPVTAAVPPSLADLRFAAASVAPASQAPAVVQEASFLVAQGNRIALMGPSGCGKSTLLTAALRLLPAVAGDVDLVGERRVVALAELSSADVPPLVAGSLQGDHVFDASLGDNLRVVRPLATDAELDEVAARVGLAAFVDALPLGWSTPAGPAGGALSGGQRQRLLLARALLAAPAILVLDEPTAHLDRVTERAVLDDLLAATGSQTLLMSTHRQLPEGALDQVLTFDGGRLCPLPRPAAVAS